jgi:hypothetical protein
MSEDLLIKIDHSALRVNQATIIILSLISFIINIPWLILFVALFMIIGTIWKIPGFSFIYKYLLKPRGWIKTNILMDNPEPHRFAQGVGAVLMTAASTILLLWSHVSSAEIIGWGMVWVVISLAALNLFAGFCVGCMLYYWFNRLQLPGFDKSPPKGTIPGMRPKTRESR